MSGCEVTVGTAVWFTHRFEVYDALTETWVLTDPTTVTAKAEDPSGDFVNIGVANVGVGIYHIGPLSVTEAGSWKYTMDSTGPAQTAVNRRFTAYGQLVP